jgi:N-acetylmuramoyl-L-alanine amidase
MPLINSLRPFNFRLITFPLIFSFILLNFPVDAFCQVKVTGIRHWSAPDETRIVLDLSNGVLYKTIFLDSPPRIVVELFRAELKSDIRNIPIDDDIVKGVRVARSRYDRLRLVVDLKGQFPYEVFLIKKMEGKPDRLLIKVKSPELEGKEADLRISISKQKPQDIRIVVIDPGHGGEDPGAIGPSGIREKDVVLSIAKELQEELNREKGVRAFLTRKGDYFIELKKRRTIAREYGADLFISIHADASFKKDTKGASVYCLSLKGATDEAARILAERENASDLIGGVISKNGDPGLDTILLDLIQTQTLNNSLEYAGMVIRELSRVNDIKFDMPRQAGFVVLKSPEFPSILVEVGFISNKKEEKLLKSVQFQKGIARALAVATLNFLKHLPPSNKMAKR